MRAALHQFFNRDVEFLVRVMRVRTDRAKYIVEALRNFQNARVLPHSRRDRHHEPKAAAAPPLHDVIQIVRKVGEIEMAVAVDKHADGSLRFRGPTRQIAGTPRQVAASSFHQSGAPSAQAGRSPARPQEPRAGRAVSPRSLAQTVARVSPPAAAPPPSHTRLCLGAPDRSLPRPKAPPRRNSGWR